MADWTAMRLDYINGGGSYRQIAAKYGINFSVLKDKAVAEGWAAAKKEHANTVRTAAEQKSVEMVSDALAEESATKARIRAKLLKMAEAWLESQAEVMTDTASYRRIVQSCAEMGVFDDNRRDDDDRASGVIILGEAMPEPEPPVGDL